MDDFGTSYASLSHLRSFPFDRLKIEQSFIAGMTESPEGRAAVAAILQLVVNPDIATIAEGVVIQQQLELPAAGRQVFTQAGSGVAGAEEWHAADGSQQSESSREGLTHQGHPFLTLDQNRYDAGVLGRRSDGNSVAGPAKPLNNASAIKLRLVRFDQIGIAWPDRSCAAVVTEVAGVIHCFR